MNYREIGTTGLLASEVGFGAEWIDKNDQESVNAIVERCLDHGINIVDCWMSDPLMRSALGTALEASRTQWIFQGHLGSTWKDGQYERTRNLDRVKEAFEDLLVRLKTDVIELGMLHFVDTDDDYDRVMNDGMLDYAQRLKAAGTIGHIGMSTHNPAIAQRAAESGVIEAIMFSCNPAFDLQPAGVALEAFYDGSAYVGKELSNTSPDRERLYLTCERNGVGLTIMKPYAGGRLFNEKDSPFGVALTAVQCLHYALTRPAVACALPGFNCIEHVDEAASYSDADEAQRDYANTLARAPRFAFAGSCTYCGHCAPCPQRIDIALVNKYADLAAQQADVPASLADHYRLLDAHAGDCVACGRCEERCPFGVPVAARMKDISRQFGF